MDRGRVLSVASECVPLVKTGGLADVVGALPGALAATGWDMRVLLPAYRALAGHGGGLAGGLGRGRTFGAGRGGCWRARSAGVPVLLLDAPHLYDREGGPYSGAERRPSRQCACALPRCPGSRARIAREGLARLEARHPACA